MPLFLLGIGKWLSAAARALWGAISRNPWPAAVIALLCVSGWLWHGKSGALAERDQARHQITLEIDAHKLTKRNYRAAQAQAQQMETARLVRVQTVYERNNADAKQGYARNVADLDVRYKRLLARERTRAIAFGPSDHKSVSEAPGDTCRAFGAPCTDELLAALRDAEETAIRLVALQGLVVQQELVPVN